MTRTMNPRMRMSFVSIRPDLAFQSTPRVMLDSPLPIHLRHRPPLLPHLHSLPRKRTRSVPPLSSRTWCSTSQLVSRPTGMRPKSTASSPARMWRPSELTCARSWPTRQPSFTINSPSRTISPRFSPSSSHHCLLCSDLAYQQGSFYTLSCSFIDIGDNVLTCFFFLLGGGVIDSCHSRVIRNQQYL